MDRAADVADIAMRVGERRLLDCSNHSDWCPLLATFDNLRDPATVRDLDPAASGGPLADGVRLKRIMVGITRQTPVRRIDTLLPWLQGLPGALVRTGTGVPLDRLPLSHRLHDGDFRQEAMA